MQHDWTVSVQLFPALVNNFRTCFSFTCSFITNKHLNMWSWEWCVNDRLHLLVCLAHVYFTILHFVAGAQCETKHKVDMVVLVDGSGSIRRDDFETIKFLIIRIVDAFIIGPDRVQIGTTFTTLCLFLCQIKSIQLLNAVIVL